MARKTIAALKVQAEETLPDNTSAEIFPVHVRNMMLDTIDTVTPAYGILESTTPVIVTKDPTPSVLPFQSVVIADAPEWEVDAAAGTVKRNQQNVANQIVFEGTFMFPAARTLTFTVFANGQPTTIVTILRGLGTTIGASVAVVGIHRDPVGPVTYELRMNTDVNVVDINVRRATFICSAIPVRV